MITLKIGNKSAFFFCGDVKLSRKSIPEVSLEVSTITVVLARGLLRGITGGTVVTSETSRKIIEDIAKESLVPKQEEIVIPEVEVTAQELVKDDIEKEVQAVAAPEQKVLEVAPELKVQATPEQKEEVKPAPKQRQKKAVVVKAEEE